jgi:hypothetical protein
VAVQRDTGRDRGGQVCVCSSPAIVRVTNDVSEIVGRPDDRSAEAIDTYVDRKTSVARRGFAGRRLRFAVNLVRAGARSQAALAPERS